MEKKTIEEIEKYLDDKELDCPFDVNDGLLINMISVTLERSDWKHGHIYLDHLMEKIGYNLVNEQVTEEDGSDCYSSVHNYMFASKEEIENFRKLFN